MTLQRFRFDSLIPLHISSRKPAVNEAVITTVLLLMIRNLPKITASYISSSFKFSHIPAYIDIKYICCSINKRTSPLFVYLQ